MKRTIKIVLLLAIFNLNGCCFDSCKDIPPYTDIIGLQLHIKQITTVNPNGSYYVKPLDSNEIINFDKFIIQITTLETYYGYNSNKNKFNIGAFFINSAYACSCADPGMSGSKELISEINVFSSYPFTSSGSTSDTLSKYFDISGQYYNGENVQRMDLDSFTMTTPKALKGFVLYVKVKPSGSLKQKFTIHYKHTNGDNFAISTPTIEFNP